MKSFLKTQHYLLILLFLVGVFYIPGLDVGYGVEEDSLTAVYTAYSAHTTEEYEMSRLPGHPAYEYLLRWLWPVHQWAYKALNVLAILISFFFLHKIVNWHEKNPEKTKLLGILFFTPVMFVTLWETMEYHLALCTLIVSWWAASKNKPLIAAIVLALSVGFRMPNLVFGLPLFLILGMRFSWRSAIQFALLTFICSATLYLPVYQKYGWEFFSTYVLPYPPLKKVIYKATAGVWGIPGTLGIIVALAGLHWRKIKNEFSASKSIPFITALVLSILLFVSLPEKSAFLMPFVILVGTLSVLYTRKNFRQMGFMLIALSLMILDSDLVEARRGAPANEASYVIETKSQDLGIRFFGFGYPLRQAKAANKLKYTHRLTSYLSTIETPTLVVTGWWYPFLQVENLEGEIRIPENVDYVYYATEAQLEAAKSQGKSILFTPEADIYNEQKYGHSLLARYGQVIHLESSK